MILSDITKYAWLIIQHDNKGGPTKSKKRVEQKLRKICKK